MSRGRILSVAALCWSLVAGCSLERTIGRFIDGGTNRSDGAAYGGDGSAYDNPAMPDAGHFPSLGPGQPLPSDDECAAQVRPAAEIRPDNTAYNQRRPTASELVQLLPWDSGMAFDERALALGRRVSGRFVGTTDEILQWGACKWGFDEDLVRAEVSELSNWDQTMAGTWTTHADECPPDAQTRAGRSSLECAKTYGLYQIMWRYTADAWPMSRDDSAFHVDLALGLRRVCFEGWATYLGDGAPDDKPYVAGDAWGCGGADYSGSWYDVSARAYVERIQKLATTRPWTQPGF